MRGEGRVRGVRRQAMLRLSWRVGIISCACWIRYVYGGKSPFLFNAKSSIRTICDCLCWVSSEGTLGREIVDGNKEVEIYGKKYQVRANIITLGGFSAHADKHDLLDWVGKMSKKPTKTYICHGDEQISLGFAETLKESFGMNAEVPYYDSEVSLEL